MTTPNEAREIILARFAEVFDALSPAVPYSLDNEAFTPPAASKTARWVRLTVRETLSQQSTLGPATLRRFDRSGLAAVEIYSPIDAGTQGSDELAEVFRDTFEGVTLGGEVFFNDCQVVDLGIEGPWWRVNALASFWFEQRK
jgi:hypothetical protein